MLPSHPPAHLRSPATPSPAAAPAPTAASGAKPRVLHPRDRPVGDAAPPASRAVQEQSQPCDKFRLDIRTKQCMCGFEKGDHIGGGWGAPVPGPPPPAGTNRVGPPPPPPGSNRVPPPVPAN